jgi:hypothetical protein
MLRHRVCLHSAVMSTRLHSSRRFWSVIALSGSLGLGCTTVTSSPTPAAEPAPVPPATCNVGESRCSGLQVQTCEASQATDPSRGDATAWSTPTDCESGQVCREGTGCTELTPIEKARVAAIDKMLATSRKFAAHTKPIDYEGLQASLRLELLTSDGSPRAYARTMWHGLRGLRQGHQYITPTLPDDVTGVTIAEDLGFTIASYTRYGACISPYKDHAVISAVLSASSPFKVGDEIVAIDGKRGAELLERFMEAPNAYDNLPASDEGRLSFGARSFLSVDRSGLVVTVKHGGDGDEVDVKLGKADQFAGNLRCSDPIGRPYRAKETRGELLPDGTGLLYVGSFQQKSTDAFEADVGPEFDKVKAAPRLILDLRGNSGGLLRSALQLVGQLTRAKSTEYVAFYTRTTGSDPPEHTFVDRVSVGASPSDPPGRFDYAGRVAILIDGGSYSAAEHLVLAARKAASVLVIGTKSAGSYGTTTKDETTKLPGSPELNVRVNRSQVRDLDGNVLEGVPQVPDIVVEYEPAALARREDPMVKRAVAELSK